MNNIVSTVCDLLHLGKLYTYIIVISTRRFHLFIKNCHIDREVKKKHTWNYYI